MIDYETDEEGMLQKTIDMLEKFIPSIQNTDKLISLSLLLDKYTQPVVDYTEELLAVCEWVSKIKKVTSIPDQLFLRKFERYLTGLSTINLDKRQNT